MDDKKDLGRVGIVQPLSNEARKKLNKLPKHLKSEWGGKGTSKVDPDVSKSPPPSVFSSYYKLELKFYKGIRYYSQKHQSIQMYSFYTSITITLNSQTHPSNLVLQSSMDSPNQIPSFV